MDEQRFWSMIEEAWGTIGGRADLRRGLTEGNASEEDAYELEEDADRVIPALEGLLAGLSADELLEFDRILERKLYDIDRADIHEHTDGSDDGFLYCRGFIVALGREYYEAIYANPSLAVLDAECEAMCYLSWHLYHDRSGEYPPPTGISRETGSNEAGWASCG